MRFFAADDVKELAGDRLVGTLHWGVYRGEDVGLLGPGDAPSLLGGEIAGVSLAAKEATFDVEVPDIISSPIQILGFLDQNLSGVSDHGDPVSLPKAPIKPFPRRHNWIRVELDFIL